MLRAISFVLIAGVSIGQSGCGRTPVSAVQSTGATSVSEPAAPVNAVEMAGTSVTGSVSGTVKLCEDGPCEDDKCEKPVVKNGETQTAEVVSSDRSASGKTIFGILTGAVSRTTNIPLVPSPTLPSEPSEKLQLKGATHEHFKTISVVGGKHSSGSLQTFALAKNGNILAVVSAGRSYSGKSDDSSQVASIVRQYDPAGEFVCDWPISFNAQAITATPSGEVIVAGNGRIARLTSEGTILKEAALPNVTAILSDLESRRALAEEDLAEEKREWKERVEELEQQLKAMDDSGGEKKKAVFSFLSPAGSLKSQLKTYRDMQAEVEKKTVESVMQESAERLKGVNAIAATDSEVFVAGYGTKGYGFTVYRFDADFTTSKPIVKNLSGCCGQMDIQCCESGIFVAENSRKRVIHYDTDGKKVASWGSAGQSTGNSKTFGGCCNPMNVTFDSSGNVLTAESEGYIKRFTPDGKFLGLVGGASVTGGCKNVAIAMSANGEKVYFLDKPGSKIVILTQKSTPQGDATSMITPVP